MDEQNLAALYHRMDQQYRQVEQTPLENQEHLLIILTGLQRAVRTHIRLGTKIDPDNYANILEIVDNTGKILQCYLDACDNN